MKDYGIKAFQKIALSTAVFYHPDYPLMALGEEVGEVLGKIAKYGRKNNLSAKEVIEIIANPSNQTEMELRGQVAKELGDVMWQWAVLCHVMDFDPSLIMEENNEKLAGRSARGTLNGEGDNR